MRKTKVKAPPPKLVAVRLAPQLHQRLRAYVQQTDAKVKAVVAAALEAYLKERGA